MKKILFTIITFIFLVVGCGNAGNSDPSLPKNNTLLPDNSTESQSAGNQPIGFETQYIRTYAYDRNAKYPIVTTIKSKAELEQYYNQYKDRYDLERREVPPPRESTIGFLDAIDKYTDEYFSDYFLVIVMVEEGSGSVRHKVDSIDESGNITIKKIFPMGLNDNMGNWNIIIEIENEFAQDNYTVSLEETEQIPYERHEIRTDGNDPNAKYPIITTIRSKAELEQYYNQYKDRYDFSRRTQVKAYDPIGFLDAVDKYTDEYFTDRFLMVFILEGEEIQGLDIEGNIIIKRFIPEEKSAKKLSAIIEIPNEFKQLDFTMLYIH